MLLNKNIDARSTSPFLFHEPERALLRCRAASGRTGRSEATAKAVFSCVVMCCLFLVYY